MNKLLLITILLIIFTGRHENQQWMSKEKSTARKSVLEMTTRSYTAGSSVFTEILPEGSEIGLFITYGNQDSLYKGASLYKNVKSKAVGSSKGSLKWKQTPQVFLRSNRPVMIYAYSPYKVQIPLDPTSIPIKISPIAAETPFYKYGRLSQGQKEVNRKSPLAKLSMNYALSLLSFEIYQDSNINGLFKLTSIQIGNRAGGNTLQYTGTMDIVTGNILFIQENPTLIRFFNACQHLGQRRLTAAVRSRDHQHFSIVHLERNTIQKTFFRPVILHMED